MLFPPPITDQIADSAYWADRMIRSELAIGIIATENDYTSNLTSTLRRQINARAVPGLQSTSFVLKPTLERRYGTDACIVLANATHYKVCLFEAKWPRLSTHSNYWDSIQKPSGSSHFDDQLARQSNFAGRFAIWEMFYCEYPFFQQPAFMPNHVSACVWHSDALSMASTRVSKPGPWTDSDLSALLTASNTQIDKIIKSVCQCEHGQAMSRDGLFGLLSEFRQVQEILLIEYNEG